MVCTRTYVNSMILSNNNSALGIRRIFVSTKRASLAFTVFRYYHNRLIGRVTFKLINYNPNLSQRFKILKPTFKTYIQSEFQHACQWPTSSLTPLSSSSFSRLLTLGPRHLYHPNRNVFWNCKSLSISFSSWLLPT